MLMAHARLTAVTRPCPEAPSLTRLGAHLPYDKGSRVENPGKNSITAILPFSALCYSFKLIAVAFLRFGLCWREAMVDGAASIKGCCCPGGREMRGHGR